MKTYWESGGKAPLILDLVTDEGEWSASRFTSRETPPDTHRIGGSAGPRADLDAVV
jgi:hypothetical protein